MIALKTLINEIASGHTPSQNDPQSPNAGASNEKIFDEIIKTLVMMREKYLLVIGTHPELAKEFRQFLEDIARVLDNYGVDPDMNKRV